MKKIINKEAKKMKKELETLYFDSIDFKAIETTNKLVKELEKLQGFELVSCKKLNAIYLHDHSKKIDNCIDKWFGFTLNNYYVYIEFGYFWIFEGIDIKAFPIKNNAYKIDKYNLKFKNDNFQDLLQLLKEPEKINAQQECIYGNSQETKNYITRNRKIEKHIYY